MRFDDGGTTFAFKTWLDEKLRTLGIEHHQILAGTPASMAPGFETAEALARSKQDPKYWARRDGKPATEAAE